MQEPNVAVLRPLEPFTMYVVQIELSNVAGSKATGDYTVRTGEAGNFFVCATDRIYT